MLIGLKAIQVMGEKCSEHLGLFQIVTLIVFEIYGTQKSGFSMNVKNVKNAVCLNGLYDCYVRCIALEIQ